MTTGSELIDCMVPANVLWHLSGGNYGSPLATFCALRPRFERLASQKYEAGATDQDGTVSIQLADLGTGT